MSQNKEQMSKYCKMVEAIRINIQWLNEFNCNQTRSRRNLLNKWFIDSIKNYFMEQHAAPLLAYDLKIKSTYQVKEIIHEHIDSNIPKYMSILNNYIKMLYKFNKISQFKSNLISMMQQNLGDFSNTNCETSYIVQKTIRKQFVGLLVITYSEIYNKLKVNSFYDLWNITFPHHKQIKMRLSKFDMINEPHIQKKIYIKRKQSKQTEILTSDQNLDDNISHSQLTLIPS